MMKHLTKHREDAYRHDPALWPWPVGGWILPAYWLTVLALASLVWWFS